jgi:hypothetical protein
LYRADREIELEEDQQVLLGCRPSDIQEHRLRQIEGRPSAGAEQRRVEPARPGDDSPEAASEFAADAFNYHHDYARLPVEAMQQGIADPLRDAEARPRRYSGNLV